MIQQSFKKFATKKGEIINKYVMHKLCDDGITRKSPIANEE
jgi:hypothetical protein